MVAIVTGGGLGVNSSSSATTDGLGKIGKSAFGQAGEQVYVNASNGNLVVEDCDQFLLGRGVGASTFRSYNSLGQLAGDNWRPGSARTVSGLTGTLNTAGSTITRTDWDGSTLTYTYDKQRQLYVASGDRGPHATLSFNSAANTWTWRDGTNQLSETFDASKAGRLVSAKDNDGNAVTYSYTAAGLLAQVSTAGGDTTWFDYNTSNQLVALRTVYQDSAGKQVTATRVRYTYDAQGRLSTVTIDQTPEDNSIADGKVFKTTYTYDGTSSRIASITQTDGAKLAFTYIAVGGDYRVESVTETAAAGASRVTRFSYVVAQNKTVITDPLGLKTTLLYDSAGRLLEVSAPLTDEPAAVKSFTYGSAGELLSTKDINGETRQFSYDSRGNIVYFKDGHGNETWRTYGANNELVTEQVWPAGGAPRRTTWYVNDSNGHQRFVVSAEGRVTEFRYNSAGQVIAELSYSGLFYDTSKLSSTSVPSESQLAAWVAAIADKSQAVRTDTTYDYRGSIATVTRYARLNADGTGNLGAGSGEVSQTRYVYDASGRLLQRFTGAPGAQKAEQFVYDGMGRLLSSVSLDGVTTLYAYDDGKHTVTITFANGLTRVSTFDAAGELISVADTASGVLQSQTSYAYDSNGNLRMVTDALGRRTHYLYDEMGRRVAMIDANNIVTGYWYEPGSNVLLETVVYATPLAASKIALLVDANGRPVEKTGASFRDLIGTLPSSVDAATDRVTWYAHVEQNVLDHTLSSDGTFTSYRYDDRGRVISTTVFANKVVGSWITDKTKAVADPLNDRTTRYFYDRDGNLQGVLDAEGYLTEYKFSAAGQLTETIRHVTAVNASLRANGTFAQIIPAANAQDIHEYRIYDAQGRLRTEVDGEGYLTTYQYDANGNVTHRIRGQKIDAAALRSPQQIPVTFQARAGSSAGVGSAVEVWIDGVKAGAVTLTSTAWTDFTVNASSIVPYQNHSIEFRSATTAQVGFQGAKFGARSFAQDTVLSGPVEGSSSQTALRYAIDAASTIGAWASTPGQTEHTACTYDAMGRVLTRTAYSATSNATTTYTYDSLGHVASETTGGQATSWRYDAEGRVTGQLSGDGSAALAALGSSPSSSSVDQVWKTWGVTYAYDKAGNRISMTDASGNRTLYYYDAVNRLSHVVNPAGEVTGYQYDAFGNIIRTTVYATRLASLGSYSGGLLTDTLRGTFTALGNDGLASVATFAWSTGGRLVQQTDAMGAKASYDYNAFGEKTAETKDVTAGAQVRNTTAYDRLGHVLKETIDAGGLNLVGQSLYDAFGRCIQTTDANGVVRKQTFDRNGRAVTITHGLGAKTSLAYDAFDNVVSSTDAGGRVTTWTYTPFNREVTVRTPEGIVTKSVYSEAGQLISLVDGNGKTTQYQYDSSGRLVSTTNATGGKLTHSYDKAGKLIDTADALGVHTTFTYDAAGRVLTRTVDPGGLKLVTKYTYDAKGNTVSVTDPSGVATVTTWDLGGRNTSVTVGASSLNVKTTFTYDAAGRVLAMTEGAGSSVARTTQYVYDKAGRLLASTVDPNGLALKTGYTYDANGNAVAVTNAAGAVTRNVYDAQGHRTWSVGPTGAVTKFTYDLSGRLIASCAYANCVNISGLSLTLKETDVTSRLTVSSTRDETTQYVSDSDGRVRYVISPLGFVTENVFDGNGNVVRTIAYATAVTISGTADVAKVASALSAQSASAHQNDRTVRMVYDAANRLVFTVDALGYVTRNTYDAADHLCSRTSYQAKYGGADNVTQASLEAWSAGAQSSSDRTVTTVYDAAGGPAYVIDAEGYITENRYDAAGRIQKSIRYADLYAAARSGTVASIKALLPATEPATAAITETRYDAAGRVTDVNSTTHYELDALGRATVTWTAYNDARLKTAVHRTFDAAGNVLEETRGYGTASASTTRYEYDAMGRLTRAFDPRAEELITANTRWALDQRKLLGVVDASGNPKAASVLSAADKLMLSRKYSTTYEYDALSHRTKVTDALGNTTSTQYDAFGNAVKVTDALGNTSYFYFDKQNRNVVQVNALKGVVRTEYSPFGKPLTVTQYANAYTGAVSETTEPSAIVPTANSSKDAVTRLEYDRLDRLVKSTDAEGYIESWSYDGLGNCASHTSKIGGATTYTYDRRGLLLSETLPVTSAVKAVVNRYEYDSRGNRVKMTEASGLAEQRVTQYQFDRLDRQVKIIREPVSTWSTDPSLPNRLSWVSATPTESFTYDSRGNLTSHTELSGKTAFFYYDEVGRMIAEVSAYGTLTTRDFDAAGNVIAERVYGDQLYGCNVSTVPSPKVATNVRETRFAYDADGRLVETRIPDVATGRYNSDAKPPRYEYGVHDIVTSTRYDALGRPVVTVDGNGNSTYTYFDRLGQKVLQIDAEGYATAWTRDAMGNASTERRYATGLGAAPNVAADATAIIALLKMSADDRITDYTYDRNNRLTSDSRLNVVYATVDANGRVTEQTGSATNRYVYDGEGHIVRRTDANGSQYDWAYDAAGRATSEQLPSFADYLGRSVRIKTTYTYNGLGQRLTETQCSADGNTANDHVTRYTYGVGGSMASKTNANGVTTTYGYDVSGNMTVVNYQRADADGKVRQEANYFTYDAAGNQTARWTESNLIGNVDTAGKPVWESGMPTKSAYNTYGEVTSQGTSLQYFAEYDKAGRVVKSNMDRGITRVYVYDANGNATLQMECQAADIRNLTIEQIYARTDVAQTFTVYDKRNLVIDVIQPTMNGAAERMGLQGKQVALAGNSGNVPITIGGALCTGSVGGLEGVIPPLSEGSPLVFSDITAEAWLNLRSNVKSTVGTIGSIALNVGSSNKADLRNLYGEFDLHVRIDYSAKDLDVQSIGSGPNFDVALASPNWHLDAYTAAATGPTGELRANVPIQLKSQAGKDGSLAYTITVYIRSKSTGQEKYLVAMQGSIGVPNGATVTPSGYVSAVAPGPRSWLSLSPVPLTTSAVNMLYYRAKGATGAFSTMAVTAHPQSGSPGVDISGLAAGEYEMIFVSAQSNGALLRRDSRVLKIPAGRLPVSWIGALSGSNASPYVLNRLGTTLIHQGGVDFYDLLASNGARVNQITVQYRQKGSTGAYTTANISGLAATGSFRWDTRGLTGTEYEVQIVLKNSGAILNTLQGSVSLTGSPGMTLSYAGQDNSPYVVFRNLPPFDTTLLRSAVVEYRAIGDSAYKSAFLSPPDRLGMPTENGTLVWDTSKLILPLKSGTYELKVTLKVYDSTVTYIGTSTITVGKDGQPTAFMTGTSAPHALTFKPDIPSVTGMILWYRPKGSTQDYQMVSPDTLIRNADESWTWSEFGLLDSSVEYEYFFHLYDKPVRMTDSTVSPKDANFLGKVNGAFIVSDPKNSSHVQWTFTGLDDLSVTIHRKQTHNAFGEVASETDGNGNVTTLLYNTGGNIISKRDPQVRTSLANGYVTTASPETHYFYDRGGNVVGVRDANGNLNSQTWNYGMTAVAKEWHGIRANGQVDGGTRVLSYDEFGNQRAVVEQVDGSTSRRTDYVYDRMGQLTEIDRPALANGQRSVDRYQYDSLGNRIAHTNALGLRDRTYFDFEGRVIQTTSAAGRSVVYGYTWNGGGWTVKTTDANGRWTTDVTDSFGRTTSHADFGGHVYRYGYNFAGLIASQQTSQYQITYEYYANGMIRHMLDTGTGTEARYEYDKNGNRTFEGYTSSFGKYAFQQSEVSYDALNRVILIKDPRYEIQYEYDAVGNRIRMLSVYNDGMTGTKARQEYWYQYDAMNRFTVTMGVLKTGVRGTSATDTSASVVAGTSGDGVTITYNLAGERIRAVYAYDGHSESYQYDANGQLTDTQINGIVRSRRTNDLAGRVTAYIEWDATGKTKTTDLSRTWDNDNLILDERNNLKGSGTKFEYLSDGTLSATQTYGEATTLRTTYTYEWWDTAKQSQVKVQASNQQVANWSPGFSSFTYDVNGHLKTASDVAGGRKFSYWTDSDGQILQRDELGNNNTARASHSYYYFGGRRVGNVGNDGVDRIDYVQEMARIPVDNANRDDRWKRFTPKNSADFDENYQPVNSEYPGSAPGRYTVRAGDTVQSLAAAYYGDATLWYVIADANGLAATDGLVTGTVLTIPNKVENIHNNALTFKPYDAGKAIGDTRPTIPAAPPPPPPPVSSSAGGRGGCGGGFIPILAVITAVVVTIVTQGAAAPVLAQALGSTAGTIATGAVAGAAGAMAAQTVQVAGGQQGSIHFSQVGMGAVAGGATAGAGLAASSAAGSSASSSALSVNGMGQAVAQGAARSVVAQGLGVMTGLQHSFDWKGVAASAISAGVGSAVGGTALGKVQFAGTMASGMAAGMASTLVRGGSVERNLGAIFADAAAASVGNMVAQQMAAQSASGKISAGGANLSGSMSALYGAGGDVNAMVQGAYPVDAGKQFALSANAQLSPVESAFDATAASLGLTRDQARALIAADSGASLVGSSLNGPGVDVRAVPYPQIAASPLPETDVRLAQTDGGFWRGLSGDRRSVFETPAPLSEKIGAGVRAVGEFFADPFIEVGNQYRDVFSAASGATGGWHSAFAQQVSDGSYGGAALTEFGAVAGAVPLAGAAFKGVGALAPKVDLAFESYAARTGALSYMAEYGGLGANGSLGAAAGARYSEIVGRVPGRILFEADALTPRGLGNDVAGLPGTFSGGRYATMQLEQPMIVYRTWTQGQSKEFGAFWSLEQPAGSLQTRIDSALLPEWGNIRGTSFNAQATHYTTIQLPVGTTIHIGEVSSQGGAWIGGNSQLLIEGGVQSNWKIGGGILR